MVVDGDAHHGLVIPAGFGAHDKSTPPDIEMLRDPGRQMEDRILQVALVQALLSAVTAARCGSNRCSAGTSPKGLAIKSCNNQLTRSTTQSNRPFALA